MSRALDLFTRVSQGGYLEVDRMVTAMEVEELFLDYKNAATVAPYLKLADPDAKNFSKAIAGFGNSDGGVIIWGVDCRSVPNEGDIPTKIIPIASVKAFRTLIDAAVSGRTLPPHPGVISLELPDQSGVSGVVITHIPSGTHVPYRVTGDREFYYIRAGSSFVPAPHAVLAGMFGRAPFPELSLEAEIGLRGDHKARAMWLTIRWRVTNTGRGIARDFYCSLCFNASKAISASTHQDGWKQWSLIDGSKVRYAYVANNFPPLPPGMKNDLIQSQFTITEAKEPLVVEFNCGVESGPGASHTFTISQELLAAALEHYSHEYKSDRDKAAGDELHSRNLKGSILASLAS